MNRSSILAAATSFALFGTVLTAVSQKAQAADGPSYPSHEPLLKVRFSGPIVAS